MHVDFLKKRLWVSSGVFLWILRSFWEHLFYRTPHVTALGGMASLLFFENRKKCPDIGEKNTLILSIFELNFLLKVKFEFLAENTSNFFLKEPLSFFLFFYEIIIQVLWFRKTSPTVKNFWLRAWVWYSLNLF